MLRERIELAELVGNPYPCNDESLRLEAGDDIILNRLPGWTNREYLATPHLHLVSNQADYMLEYWSAEWSGVPNLAKERGEKLAEQKKQEQEAENKAYDKIYGPPAEYRAKSYKNFVPSGQAVNDQVDEISDWPWKYHSKENDEEICWPDSDTYYLNLILAGPPGTGKTHLACALYFAHRGAFFYGAEIIRFETLVRKFKEKEQKDSTLFRRYGDGFVDGKDKMDRGCELLVIDDVGVDKSEYARQILIEIIDRRNAAGLSTVITTNLSKAELSAMLGDRGASRLFHRCLAVGMPGADYRAKPPNSDASEG
jgi:DNA replication protein DnaC